MLKGKNILITGGTGSFGKKFARHLLEQHQPGKVILYSRDELKQFELAQDPVFRTDPVRFFIGDVRDAARLRMAMEGVHIVVHAAALKQVPTAEYNPFECIKTNVLGAQNVIEAALATGVENVVALSTDKAAAPINLYGATKLCSDKLFIAANNIKGRHNIRFSVVRYGNVMGSRGSVIPFFLSKKGQGVLPITDPSMTRFNITLDEGVDLVLHALKTALGGEIFVPRIPSYRITDVAKAIDPEARLEVVGIRPGEKIHEEMITATDSYQTIETPHGFIIIPMLHDTPLEKVITEYSRHHQGKLVPRGFAYNSGTNTEWLSVEQIRLLIEKHVLGNFS